MTLLDLIQRIEAVAAAQPQIAQVIGGDVYALNADPDARYGVFCWTQGQHSATATTDLATFRFTLFYIDRLSADKSNETEVQSVGCQVLANIIRTLYADGVVAGDYTLQPFTQRFADECAGVFASVGFAVPFDTLCEQTFE